MLENNLAKQAETEVQGIIEHVTYYSEQNSYAVLQIKLENSFSRLTVAGPTSCNKVGTAIKAWGSFTVHPKYGKQFNARSILETEPATTDGIIRYLGSGQIKGVGPSTAERIVKQLGSQTMEIIRSDPGRVSRIRGVGKHKANLLFEAFSEQHEKREILQFLIGHEIPPLLSEKIFKRFGSKTIDILKKDPYLLATELRGVGFLTADRIAQSLGIKPDSPERLRAGILYALEKASDDGHCYLPAEILSEKARALLDITPDVDLNEPLKDCINSEKIRRHNDMLYLEHIERAEAFIASFVSDRISKLENPTIPLSQVARALQTAEQSLGLKLSAEQQQAVVDAPSYRLLVITGGPGCGKTTIIRALSTLYQQANKILLLAAPTGRAAQRMSSVCDRAASTIHRLLKYDPMTGRFLYGINQPLNADAIIIDEASMIDINLAASLFQAISRNTTLILVGDKDQLPSVGPGRVFGELVEADVVKTVLLSQIFRREEESSINGIAHTLNAGLAPTIPEPDGIIKSDAYFIVRKELDETARTVETLVADQLPKKFGFAPNEIMVLTPTNRGPLGTHILNERLQERLNPSGKIDSEQEITVHSTTLRVGDRVCQRVNNYSLDDIGVFNGDIGTITEVDARERRVVVELWDGRLIKYSASELGQLSLAYALTVHRAQGSESPCVVLVLHDSHYVLLEKQLVYTAITRAKKLLIIVGSRRALFLGSKRAMAGKRFAGLGKRLDSLAL
jgi:exodeoxyribonuclease V alpha subunit